VIRANRTDHLRCDDPVSVFVKVSMRKQVISELCKDSSLNELLK
jgi:hypothetical protein